MKLPKGVYLKDLRPVYERTVVAMCKESRCQTRFMPADIDAILQDLLPEFPDTLDALGSYIEAEEWDELHAMALQERTMRLLRRRT